MRLKLFIVFHLMYVGVIAQIRYADSLFNSLNVFANVQYGKAINIKGAEEVLLLDVFVPPTADKIRYRPLVIYVHGGGFVNNTKTSDLSTLICTTLAKKGYVTATFDYRLGIENPKSTTQYFEAMYRAQQDVKAAIRYFKKYAEDYGIDKTQIYLVGGSAGAMTALSAVYMNDNEVPSNINTSKWGSLNGTSGNDGFSSNVAGVVNLWGALPNFKWIQQGDTPLLNIGGTDDKTVPYDSAFDYHGFKYGPMALYNYCKSIGVSTELRTFIGAGHTINKDVVRYDSAIETITNWLYKLLPVNNQVKQPAMFKRIIEKQILQPTTILTTMEKVANWQMNLWDEKGYKYHTWHWANAAGYTGYFELSKISKNTNYENRLLEIGREIDWNTGPSRFFADDYCIAQTYANLYMKYKDPKMLARFKLLADTILAQPHTESLEWKDSINYREWAWCDALFMGPTALAYFSTAIQEPKYLDLAVKLWWQTHDYLYDSTEHLYFRDQRFFTQQEKNGKKVFWSRGNGWVLAGLVRVLDNMPENYTDKPKFKSLYKEMIAKVASLQQPDGSWHTSLLDPASYPNKEISGTGFYAYAILWGLNNGMLDKATYWPIALKSWKAMMQELKQDGMIGYIQPIGAAPDLVNEHSTEIYGIGAFLLAGTELYKYMSKQ